MDRATLARRVQYSRSQLYEILDGRISRPPEWDRLVEPLVQHCTGGDPAALRTWRRRHEVMVEVYTALGRQARRQGGKERHPRALPPCPYRGLAAFREEDAAQFHGREELTDRLVSRLRSTSLMGLVGPSGSGKSSLVFAGAVPRLRQAGWAVVDVRPAVGSSPLSTLAAALLPLLEPDMSESLRLLEVPKLAQALIDPGLTDVVDRSLQRQGRRHLLLVVDQFEELYARGPTVAQQFVDVLLQPAAAVREGGLRSLTIALTLRADFLGPALEHARLAGALQDSTLMIGRMTTAQLRRAIEGPLPDRITYEAGLVERILADVGEEAGQLALLEFTLTMLWERQREHTLTHAVYTELGGVQGAVTEYAEEVYRDRLETSEAEAARLCVQLVRPGQGTEPTRRVARRGELDPALWPIAQRLASTRLVVTGRDEAGAETVEIAHEALISCWGRLRQWVAADRDFRAWQERLRTAMEQYAAGGHDSGSLLRGASLVEALDRLPRHDADIGPAEKDFIRASKALQRRTVRRLQVLAGTLVALLLLAVTLGVSAEQQRRQVAVQERQAVSRALASQADDTIDERPIQSILLSLQAFNEADTAEARGSLLRHVFEHQQTQGFLIGHKDRVSGVAFSPDGHSLATACNDATIRLWNVADRRTAATLTGHTDRVLAVAFSPDGHTLASVSDDRTVRLWGLGAQPRQLAVLTGHQDRVSGVVFSPDGRTLATADKAGTVRLWDVTTRRERAVLTGHEGWVRSVVFSPDGRTLATGGIDATIRLWTVATRRTVATLTGHTDRIRAVAFSPDGRSLASAGDDRSVRLWNTGTHQLLATLVGHDDVVSSMAFHPEGRTLATAGQDNTVRIWDVTTHRERTVLTGHTDWISGLAFSPDGRTLATGANDNTVRLWNTGARRAVRVLAGNAGMVTGVAFGPDGRTLATSGEDSTIRLLNVVTGTSRTAATDWSAAAVAFSPDGRTLSTGSLDGKARLWNVSEQRVVATLTGHRARVRGVAFSPDGRILASTSEDHTVRLWDVAARRPLATLTGHTDWVSAVAFSPDGRILATGSADRTVRLWDVAAHRPLATLTGHTNWVSAVAFSPDGRTLATGSADASARLWNVADRQQIATLTGHTGWLWAIAFSPDGRTLVTGSDDRTVRLWDVAAHRPLATLTGHTGWVLAAAFTPDGRTLATGSQDRTVRLWDMRLRSWQRHLCRLAGRNLTRQEWNEFLSPRPYRETCPDHLRGADAD
nr:WD40 repeat domain-containing protein [Streptomyces poonensis]